MSETLLTQPLNHQAIEKQLPHAGKMCLLDEVILADEKTLTATAISHLEADNPLSIKGCIAMVNGIEYAAQAMAVHSSLLAKKNNSDQTPQKGYIATVRNIDIKAPYFPKNDYDTAIIIEVEQLMSNDSGFTYQFQINHKHQALISGKITIFLITSQTD